MNSEISKAIDLIQEDKLIEALNQLEKVIEDNDSQTNLVLLKRRIKENKNSFNKGILTYEDFSVQKNRVSLAVLDIISEIDRNPSIQIRNKELSKQYYSFGNVNLKNGKFYKAILYLTKAIIANSKFIQAYIDRGVAKCAIGSYQEAIQDFKIAIDISPIQPFAFLNLGIAYYQLGDTKKACKNWRKVKELGFDIADNNLENVCKKNTAANKA